MPQTLWWVTALGLFLPPKTKTIVGDSLFSRSVSPSFSGLKGKTSLCKHCSLQAAHGPRWDSNLATPSPLPWPSPPPSRALALCHCEVSAVAVRAAASFTAVTPASECSDGHCGDDSASVILPVPSLHSDREGPGQRPPLTCLVQPLVLPHPDSGLPSSALFLLSRLPPPVTSPSGGQGTFLKCSPASRAPYLLFLTLPRALVQPQASASACTRYPCRPGRAPGQRPLRRPA